MRIGRLFVKLKYESPRLASSLAKVLCSFATKDAIFYHVLLLVGLTN